MLSFRATTNQFDFKEIETRASPNDFRVRCRQLLFFLLSNFRLNVGRGHTHTHTYSGESRRTQATEASKKALQPRLHHGRFSACVCLGYNITPRALCYIYIIMSEGESKARNRYKPAARAFLSRSPCVFLLCFTFFFSSLFRKRSRYYIMCFWRACREHL